MLCVVRVRAVRGSHVAVAGSHASHDLRGSRVVAASESPCGSCDAVG